MIDRNNKFYKIYIIILLLTFSPSINAQETNSINLGDGASIAFNSNYGRYTEEIADGRGVVTLLQYDEEQKLINESSQEQGETFYIYDEKGNISGKHTSNGTVTKLKYDEKNRLIREVVENEMSDRLLNIYQYGGCKNGEDLLCKVKSNSIVTNYTYHKNGKVKSSSVKFESKNAPEKTIYGYNSNDKLDFIEYPSGLKIKYGYNSKGDVRKVTGFYRLDGIQQSFHIVDNLNYLDKKDGLISRIRFSNGLKTKYDWDVHNRIEAIKTTSARKLINQFSYKFNNQNKIAKISFSGRDEDVAYEYDDIGRLVEERYPVHSSIGSISYRYDEAGNRLSMSSPSVYHSYEYGANSNKLEAVNRYKLSYDNVGNLLNANKNKSEYVYDVSGRFSEYLKSNKKQATYRYNHLGQRIQKVIKRTLKNNDEFKSISYSYDVNGWLLSENLYNTQNKRNVIKEYVWLKNKPIAQLKRSIMPDGNLGDLEINYIHTDHLNTPRFATNKNGEISWKWLSDGFGNGQTQKDVDKDGKNTEISLRFPGHYYDNESKLFYNGYRNYNPKFGRYTQADPIGLMGGLNRYIYSQNDPINLIDRYGLSVCTGTKLHKDNCDSSNSRHGVVTTGQSSGGLANLAYITSGCDSDGCFTKNSLNTSSLIVAVDFSVYTRRYAQSVGDLNVFPLGPNALAQSGLSRAEVVLLDPKLLQRAHPVSNMERLIISTALDAILSGDITPSMGEHDYDNITDPETGARLPTGDSYTTYYLGGQSSSLRLVIGKYSGRIFYTNTHYRHFIPVVLLDYSV